MLQEFHARAAPVRRNGQIEVAVERLLPRADEPPRPRVTIRIRIGIRFAQVVVLIGAVTDDKAAGLLVEIRIFERRVYVEPGNGPELRQRRLLLVVARRITIAIGADDQTIDAQQLLRGGRARAEATGAVVVRAAFD